MNPSKISLSEQVASLLARGEPMTAAQLCAATGKSQPSISLALQALGDRVCKIGAARSTRYALKSDILGLQPTHDLVWAGSDEMPRDFGGLTYLSKDQLYVRSAANTWLTQGCLPWFLTPLRPQGFLGRELARLRPDFPSDLEQWTLAQILFICISEVHDPIGAFFFNEVETSSWLVPESADSLGTAYDALASQIGQGLPAGSSAAGEQPKFTVQHQDGGRFIVKFSPPRGTPFGERWHALLCLEQLALFALKSHGVEVAETALIQTMKRSYLQSQRFDRVGTHAKRHVVAISALHDEFTPGAMQNWVHTAQGLHAKKLISQQELSTIATIHAFGHYIGNTDMHFGNLSFFVDDVITPKIRLAPVYDMLPMMWRPEIHQGSLSDAPVRAQLMPAGFAQEQEQAREWAIEFWEQAAKLDIGADLQSASVESARRITTNFADV
jgi:chromosome segregation and condensation protein ScpB